MALPPLEYTGRFLNMLPSTLAFLVLPAIIGNCPCKYWIQVATQDGSTLNGYCRLGKAVPKHKVSNNFLVFVNFSLPNLSLEIFTEHSGSTIFSKVSVMDDCI